MCEDHAVAVEFVKQNRLWQARSATADAVNDLYHYSPAVLAMETLLTLEDAFAGQQTDVTITFRLNSGSSQARQEVSDGDAELQPGRDRAGESASAADAPANETDGADRDGDNELQGLRPVAEHSGENSQPSPSEHLREDGRVVEDLLRTDRRPDVA